MNGKKAKQINPEKTKPIKIVESRWCGPKIHTEFRGSEFTTNTAQSIRIKQNDRVPLLFLHC